MKNNRQHRLENHIFCAILNVITLWILFLAALLDALAAAAW